MRAMRTGLAALGVALLALSCGTERPTETGTGGAASSTGGIASASGGTQQGGTTSTGGTRLATGGQLTGGSAPASGGTGQGGTTSSGGRLPATGGRTSGGSAGMTGNCGDLVETDILARWTSGASDDPPASTTLSVLGAGSALLGQALRAVTNAGFDF